MDQQFNKQNIFFNIAYLCDEQGITIDELERAVDVSPGTLSEMKNEGPAPEIAILAAVANRLGVSIDAMVYGLFFELSSTERYLVPFLEKLEKDTLFEELDWDKESAVYLNQMDPDSENFVDHPLFELASFVEETYDEYSQWIADYRMRSRSFDIYTRIAGDCFKLRMGDAVLYLMDISKSVIHRNDPDAYAKEIWMYHPDKGTQYLCSNKDILPVGSLVEHLFSVVEEESKHPKVKPSFRAVIDTVMAGHEVYITE